jgi:hypothetical protein
MKITEIADGAIQDLFDAELEGIFENIQDVNTEAVKPRELMIKIKFIPNDARDAVGIEIAVSSKMAPPRVIITRAAVEAQGMIEFEIPRQKGLPFNGVTTLKGGKAHD